MSSHADTSAPGACLRVDVWLWAARFFRTRALAKQAVEGGRVELNGATAKPSRSVQAGDRLHIRRGEERFDIEVVGVSRQRGPARVAQALYSETPASAAARAAAAEQRRLRGDALARPPKRPDKRARRLIRALGDIDMT